MKPGSEGVRSQLWPLPSCLRSGLTIWASSEASGGHGRHLRTIQNPCTGITYREARHKGSGWKGMTPELSWPSSHTRGGPAHTHTHTHTRISDMYTRTHGHTPEKAIGRSGYSSLVPGDGLTPRLGLLCLGLWEVMTFSYLPPGQRGWGGDRIGKDTQR